MNLEKSARREFRGEIRCALFFCGVTSEWRFESAMNRSGGFKPPVRDHGCPEAATPMALIHGETQFEPTHVGHRFTRDMPGAEAQFALAGGQVDARSDIYSLGLVVAGLAVGTLSGAGSIRASS